MKSSVAWLLSEKLLRVLNGILVGAAVARHLGPESFGLLAVALASIGVFTATAGMGAEQVHISEFAKRTTVDQKFFSSILLARIIWAIFVATVGLAFVMTRDDGVIDPLYLVLLPVVSLAAFSLYANTIASYAEFRSMCMLAISVLLFGSALRLYGVFSGYGVTYFAACLVIESVIGIVLNGIYLYRKYQLNPLSLVAEVVEIKRYLKLSLPMAVTAGLVTIYLRLEIFIVNNCLGEEAAGHWAAAMMFVSPWGMVAVSILPVANQYLSKNQNVINFKYEEGLIKLIRLMALASILFILINIASVTVLTPVLLGEKYMAIKDVVAICSLSLLPLFMGSVQDVWSAQQRTTKTLLYKIALGLPLSATLLWFGATYYGLKGVAFGVVVAHIVTVVVLNYFMDKKYLSIQLRAFGFKSSIKY